MKAGRGEKMFRSGKDSKSNLSEFMASAASVVVLGAILTPVLVTTVAPVLADQKDGSLAISMNRAKVLSLATILYASDNDDKLPAGIVKAGSGPSAWRIARAVPVPEDWCPTYLTAFPLNPDYSSYWANAIRPEIPGGNYFASGGQSSEKFKTAAAGACYSMSAEAKRSQVGFSYNGLLQSYSLGSIHQPDKCPLYWQGTGKANIDGFAVTNHQLNCADGSLPCVFVPDQYPQSEDRSNAIFGGGGSPGYGSHFFWAPGVKNNTAWVHDKGLVMSSASGAARFVYISAPESSSASFSSKMKAGRVSRTHPFSRLDSDRAPGTPYYTAYCNSRLNGVIPSATNVVYDCFFRPDSDYKQDSSNASDY